MISKETIDKIFDTARIDEVVGEFVNLKKRGVNLIGLCPFHNEKTPSFNVNPARNIYKCFGCGKGGTSVNFIIEHEHLSYPDALRYLAKKYNIEIEEEQISPELEILRDEKESMLLVNGFAQKYFSDTLINTEDGKAIGLTYFKERGFSRETIEKFQLGYSSDQWDAFTKHALKQEYKEEFLVKTGLTIKSERGLFDRFKGRVMFPIHNLAGRVIAFGGRILKKDEKTAKYLNSPESEVYHKSQVLYGIFFAKKAIVEKDNCFLTEGYTDVISLHQAGIENVVASSGTALTVEQIRLISRYTKNITVLYDADPAGIKASLRGIDMILEEGLNVKVVLFPQGEDPDSFSRSHSSSEVLEFLRSQSKDFMVFKTGLLLGEVANDPIAKAGLIRDVVESISKIPDAITRSVYIKQCSQMMEIDEQVLLNELNKSRKSSLKRIIPPSDVEELMPDIIGVPQPATHFDTESQEREIIRLLLNFGNEQIHFYDETEIPDSDGKKETVTHTYTVAGFITEELVRDELRIADLRYKFFFDESCALLSREAAITPEHFYKIENPEISSLAVELLSPKYFLSGNWNEMHKIIVPLEESNLRDAVEKAVYHLKNKMVMKMIDDNQHLLKEAYTNGEEYLHLLEYQKKLDEVKKQISKTLGIDVLR
ncbi:MAG: DNA primase [Bacteroidetes bacterium]|nr:DNA primase [Bacteroidota bacterium]